MRIISKAEMARPVCQYAVKVLVDLVRTGKSPSPQHPGKFLTNVNVHNPWYHDLSYTTRLVTSGTRGIAGECSSEKAFTLKPVQATNFDSGYLWWQRHPRSWSFDGFFVIESHEELDVVGVYTTTESSPNGPLLEHMERVPMRLVPSRYFESLIHEGGVRARRR